MSKYIKLEDAEKLLTNALRIAQGFEEPLERSLVDIPTIDIVTCEECKHTDCERTLAMTTCHNEIEEYAELNSCSCGERIEE